MMPTLDKALLCSTRAGSDLGRVSGLVYFDGKFTIRMVAVIVL